MLLSEPYEIQYKAMKDFARWNLPEETGLSWIDVFDVCFSTSNNDSLNVSEELVLLLQNIKKQL